METMSIRTITSLFFMNRGGFTQSRGSPHMDIVQKTIGLPVVTRGCHLITDMILEQVPELQQFRVGMLNIFLQHTSASITINENCSPEVGSDFESWMNTMVPEGSHWQHSSEGPDDMPAHAKCSMIGVSLDIPITNGALNLGTWQGIYLNEHRGRGGSRKIVLTIIGQK
jgi:secondary thiamine-phosphate synthase enzyme